MTTGLEYPEYVCKRNKNATNHCLLAVTLSIEEISLTRDLGCATCAIFGV